MNRDAPPAGPVVDAPRVSVCIPVYNGADVIGRQVEAIAGQVAAPSFEVVVSDNGSTDGSGHIADQVAAQCGLDLRVVDASRARGVNVARNEALSAARGDVVLYCDADDEVSPDWVRCLSEPLLGGAAIAGGVAVKTVIESGDVIAELTGSRESDAFFGPIGACFGVRRDVALRVGGFDESWREGHDEIEFAYRVWKDLGEELLVVPAARVAYWQHEARLDVRALSRAWRRGKAQGRFRALLASDGHAVRRATYVRAARVLAAGLLGHRPLREALLTSVWVAGVRSSRRAGDDGLNASSIESPTSRQSR